MTWLEFLGMLLIAMIVLHVLAKAISPRDDTDSDKARSGMRLYTDHKTGMQYLGAQGGGITPRLDQNGKHMRGE